MECRQTKHLKTLLKKAANQTHERRKKLAIADEIK